MIAVYAAGECGPSDAVHLFDVLEKGESTVNADGYELRLSMEGLYSLVTPGKMTYVINNAHIYENQVEGIREQIRRRDEKLAKDGKLFDAPKLYINQEIKDFFKFDNSKELKDIKLENYEHQGRISMPVTE